MKVIILLCFCAFVFGQTFDFTKYYGTYYLDVKDTQECENSNSACCIGDRLVISTAGQANKFAVKGNFTIETYTMCNVPDLPFNWTFDIIDATTGRTTFGLQSQGTANIGFADDDDGTGYIAVVSIQPGGYNFYAYDSPRSSSASKLEILGVFMSLMLLFL